MPLELDTDTFSCISAQSQEAKTLRQSDLIIWDEATASHKYAVDLLDRLLRRRCSARRGAPGEGRVWGRRGAGRGGIGREPWTTFPAGPAAGESEPYGGTESHGRRGNVTHGPIPEARRDPRSDGVCGAGRGL